ncbi:MAG: alanine racemase [Rhodothermia bacterium]|nr:MAG: alanine racemase [Rhodothermia bacterium]
MNLSEVNRILFMGIESHLLSPTQAIIDLASLTHNLRVLEHQAGDINVIGVVKADAYGHGSVEVSKALISSGVGSLAVATVAEAVVLRQAGIEEIILVFGAPRTSSIEACVEYDLEPFITGLDSLDVIRSFSGLRVHLLVDTGMARLGVHPDEVKTAIQAIERMPGNHLQAISTHFASAGQPGSAFVREQWGKFESVLANLESKPAEVHLASTSALFTVPESIDPDIVDSARIGIGLYGLLEPLGYSTESPLKPVMTLQSEVAHVKWVKAGAPVSYNAEWCAPERTRIATVAAGYADGYPRILSNRASVGINGSLYPVVGAICMDLFMVNLGPGPANEAEADTRINPGDKVILFGSGGPSAIKTAEQAETIPYELVCCVGTRVPRIYSS